jgi:hypothetical protein
MNTSHYIITYTFTHATMPHTVEHIQQSAMPEMPLMLLSFLRGSDSSFRAWSGHTNDVIGSSTATTTRSKRG